MRTVQSIAAERVRTYRVELTEATAAARAGYERALELLEERREEAERAVESYASFEERYDAALKNVEKAASEVAQTERASGEAAQSRAARRLGWMPSAPLRWRRPAPTRRRLSVPQPCVRRWVRAWAKHLPNWTLNLLRRCSTPRPVSSWSLRARQMARAYCACWMPCRLTPSMRVRRLLR